MKFDDVPIGTYILLPCARCGVKRRRKVRRHGSAELARMREQICQACHHEDVAEGHYLSTTPNMNKMPN